MEQLRNMLNLDSAMDMQTQVALVIAVALIINHHLKLVELPLDMLKENSMILAGATVIATYIDLKYGVVLAALLYISMDSTTKPTEESTDKEIVESEEVQEEASVSGNIAMPELESSSNPLSTQDNSAPTEDHVVPHPENGSPDVDETPYRMGVLEGEEDKDNTEVIGFGGESDLASV